MNSYVYTLYRKSTVDTACSNLVYDNKNNVASTGRALVLLISESL